MSDRLNQTLRKTSIASEENNDSVAADLEQMFNEDFKDAGLTSNNAFQESLAAFHRKITNSPTSMIDSLLSTSMGDRQHRTISYEQLLYTMTLELVEMLSVRFGSLGCYRLGDMNSRFYAVSLANDDTPTMFESTIVEEPDPLIDFDSHRTIQMIEIWFSVHPLSNIISKTLFLRNYRSNTHDQTLLAVMLADASYVHENDVIGDSKETLFRWTAAQLRDRLAHECGLSTAQVLMLLGWHELCLSRARRATCYLGYAGRIVARLQKNLVEVPQTGHSQINGIDVAEVEAELVRNIYWLTFSITVWSFMQIDQPYPQLLPSTIPTAFPPVDDSSSAVVKLEVVSDNVSTLAKQSRVIQELWPLSHIASTTAHIYALLPRGKDVDEISQSPSWQSQPLYQLRRLLSLNQNISSLCVHVRKVLVSAVEVLEVKVENALSKALVLTAYHTTIIHLLFPRLDSIHDRVVVSEELLTDFCTSGWSLLELFSVVEVDHDTNHLITRMRSSTFADIFVLGLDVCSRAIAYFYTRSQEGSALECESITRKAADLMSIASQMHKSSKSETLLTAKNLRLVKKKLKNVKLLFHPAGAPHGIGSASSIDDGTTKFANSGDSTLSPTPTTSAASFQGNQSVPELHLDTPVQGLPPHDFNAPLPAIWPRSAPLEFSSAPHHELSSGGIHALDQIDWGGNANAHEYNDDNIEAILGIYGNINKGPGGPPETTTGPPGRNDLAGDLQGHSQLAASETAAGAIAFGEDVPNLYDVGMDIDFFDLGVLGDGDSWPLAGRPLTGRKTF